MDRTFHDLVVCPPAAETPLRMSKWVLVVILKIDPKAIAGVDFGKYMEGKCQSGFGHVPNLRYESATPRWDAVCLHPHHSKVTLLYHRYRLDGWLSLDVFAGQCQQCGRIFYG